MKSPDITPAQIVSAVGAVVGLLASNLLLDPGTAKLVTDLAAIIVPTAWMIADAVIRHGRAKATAAKTEADSRLAAAHVYAKARAAK